MKRFLHCLTSEHQKVRSSCLKTEERPLSVATSYPNLDSILLPEKLRQMVAGGAASLPMLIDDSDYWQ